MLKPETCPVFYGYGTAKGKKNFMFHSPEWIKKLKENSDYGCQVHQFDCDHWVSIEKSEELNERVL